MRAIRRKFPDYGWAWPTGQLDILLKSILLADEDRALDLALHWLAENNIDHVSFREQRLLAAISHRFGKRLSVSPAHPRLMGLQRMLWSRSRIALHESREALEALSEANIPFMLIKGAGRIALDGSAQRGRVSHDIDVLVQPRHIAAAFGILLDLGWQASTGAGALRLKEQAATFRALNFFKGSYGDVDLHRIAYHPIHANDEDEAGLWLRSIRVVLDGVPAFAPCPADRVALAIAHGGLDAHVHSDWLVDTHSAILSGAVDWPVLLETLTARQLLVPAAATLSYLAFEVGSPIPTYILGETVLRADRMGLVQRARLLESKPRTDFNGVSAAARSLVKQVRLLREKLAKPASTHAVWRARCSRKAKASGNSDLRNSATASCLPFRKGTAEIIVEIDLPANRRRIDIELSTNRHHLAVLRFRKLTGYSGMRRLHFKGPIHLDEGDEEFFLEARPSRFSRALRDTADMAQNGPLPFSLIRLSIR